MAKKQLDDQSAVELVDLITNIVRAELDKRDNTVLGRIVQRSGDNNYDLYIEPDMDTIVRNIPTITGMEELRPGDYVYVFKIGNKFNTSFIIKKL